MNQPKKPKPKIPHHTQRGAKPMKPPHRPLTNPSGGYVRG